MSEDFGTFDNKFMMLVNPLPSVTEEELHRRARVPLRKRKNAKREVFALDLRYGSGEDLKTASLLPSKQIRVAHKFGMQIVEDFKPQASICATAPGLAWFVEDGEREQAILEALNVAADHYHVLGFAQLDKVRAERGHREEEVERLRGSTYSTYFLAIAKEELIREQIEKFEGSAARIKKAS